MTLTLSNPEKRRGWLYLFLQMLAVPYAVGALCRALGITSPATANAVAFYTNGLLALMFFRELLASSCRNVRWGKLLWVAAKGFGLYWALNLLTQLVIFAIKPDFSNINDPTITAMIREQPWLMSIAVVFFAPLAEECLFRGWIFTGLAQRNLPLAYGVTACFFSAAHILGYVGRYDPLTLLLCFLQYLGPSIALCFTCRKADSLLAPMLLHMTINAIALILTR